MKVLTILAVLLASATSLGSGPYLPSGWRPKGPSFLLPTEVEKPASPLQVAQQEETLGLEFLKEYGPPKNNYLTKVQEITLQALPDIATEHTFAVEAEFADENSDITKKVSEDTNETPIVQTETETSKDSQLEGTRLEAVKGTSSFEERGNVIIIEHEEIREGQEDISGVVIKQEKTSGDFVKEEEISSDVIKEDVTDVGNEETAIKEEIKEETLATVVQAEKTIDEVQKTEENLKIDAEKIEEEIEADVRAVEEGVKSIAEALVSLENEFSARQAQEAAAKNNQDFGSVKIPLGFLEYGPPGFKEYGPPKDDILRSDTVVVNSAAYPTVTNEARRRHFSPKLTKLHSITGNTH